MVGTSANDMTHLSRIVLGTHNSFRPRQNNYYLLCENGKL